MNIQKKLIGSDSAEIWADDRIYYRVDYNPVIDKWTVRRYFRAHGGSVKVGDYASAEDAINSVKAMLSEKASELSDALDALNDQ